MKPIGPEAARQAYIGFMNALASAAQALTVAQVPPESVALFYNKALSLWEQDSPELRDSFAQLFGQAATNAGMAPQASPQASPQGPGMEDSIAAGAAVNPATGEPLTIPAAAQPALAPSPGVPTF